MAPLISDVSPLLSEYYEAMQASGDPYPGLDGFLTGRAMVGPLEQLDTHGSAEAGKAQPVSHRQPRHESHQNPD
jgi:hypothetical protein